MYYIPEFDFLFIDDFVSIDWMDAPDLIPAGSCREPYIQSYIHREE